MSFCATIQGDITYPDQEHLDAALEMLGKDVEDGWIKGDKFVDEAGSIVCDNGEPDIDGLTLHIPLGCYRNMFRVLDAITEDTESTVVWTSTDGCFEGGVLTNDKKEYLDLEEWAKENDMKPPVEIDKSSDDDWQEYSDWQTEVEDAFHETFG